VSKNVRQLTDSQAFLFPKKNTTIIPSPFEAWIYLIFSEHAISVFALITINHRVNSTT